MGYSWDIHGVFICVGYVSVMYRLCVGYVTEYTGSEGGAKKQVKNGANHGRARTGTDGHGNTEYDTSYAYGERSKLSKPKMGIFINKENNKHPCAGAQRSKLSKPQAGIFINNENNYIQQWRQ